MLAHLKNNNTKYLMAKKTSKPNISWKIITHSSLHFEGHWITDKSQLSKNKITTLISHDNGDEQKAKKPKRQKDKNDTNMEQSMTQKMTQI